MKTYFCLFIFVISPLAWGDGWKTQPADQSPQMITDWLNAEPILRIMRSRLVFSSGAKIDDLKREPSAIFDSISVPVVSGRFKFTNDAIRFRESLEGDGPKRWITDMLWFDVDPQAEVPQLRQAGLRAEYVKSDERRFALYGLTFCQSTTSCQRHGIPIAPEGWNAAEAAWATGLEQRPCAEADWQAVLHYLPSADTVARFSLARFSESLGLSRITGTLLPLDTETAAKVSPQSVERINNDVARISGRLSSLRNAPDELACHIRLPPPPTYETDSRRVIYLIGSRPNAYAGYRVEYFKYRSSAGTSARRTLSSVTICGNRDECARLGIINPFAATDILARD